MRFCTSCGTQLQDGAQVCPNCGQRVVGVNPKPMGGGPAWNGWSTWDEWPVCNGSSTGNVCENTVKN